MAFVRLLAIAWIIFWTGLCLSQVCLLACLFLSAGTVAVPWLGLSVLALLCVATALLLVWARAILAGTTRANGTFSTSLRDWAMRAAAFGWFAFNGWDGYLSARARLHQLAAIHVTTWSQGPGRSPGVHAALISSHRAIAELHQLLRLTEGYHLSSAVLDLGPVLGLLLIMAPFRAARALHHS